MYEILRKPVEERKEHEKGTAGKNNKTGIPERTKAYFEDISGMSFDDVRVHYASAKPAGFGALAYTQGNDVYVGPGQERHLGHELAHVVQQKQGRVVPTGEIGGVPANTDSALEQEADRIGSLAQKEGPTVPSQGGPVQGGRPVVQGKFPSNTIKESIRNAGGVSGHHILSQADLGRLCEAALRKRRSGVRKKDWPNLYQFCEQYCECEGGPENLGFNIVAGPKSYINNPGDRFDPQTFRATIGEADAEYLGMTQGEIAGFGMESRQLTAASESLKGVLDIMASKNYDDWTETEWGDVLRRFEEAEEDSEGRETVRRPADDEWVEERDGKGKDTFYRKQEGYFMNRAVDGTDTIFSIAEQKRKYEALDEKKKVEGEMKVAVEGGEPIDVAYTISLGHVLKRHSFLWCGGEFTGKNIFFPLSMDEDAISDWCNEKARAHIEKVIVPAFLEEDYGMDTSHQGIYGDVFLICNIDPDDPIQVEFETMSMESEGIQVTQKTLNEAWQVYQQALAQKASSE